MEDAQTTRRTLENIADMLLADDAAGNVHARVHAYTCVYTILMMPHSNAERVRIAYNVVVARMRGVRTPRRRRESVAFAFSYVDRAIARDHLHPKLIDVCVPEIRNWAVRWPTLRALELIRRAHERVKMTPRCLLARCAMIPNALIRAIVAFV